MSKNILLVGGLNKAKSLADSLLSRSYNVTLINKDPLVCEKLAEDSRLKVFLGDGTKPFILEEAAASEMDMVIALTSKDEDNLLICELCKKRFHVKKTVAIVMDPQKLDFFRAMGIDSPVCAVSALTSVIEQHAFIEDIKGAVSVAGGLIKIVEVSIVDGDFAEHKEVQQLGLPREVIIGTILRGDKVIVPKGDTVLLANDQLIVLATEKEELSLLSHFRKGGLR